MQQSYKGMNMIVKRMVLGLSVLCALSACSTERVKDNLGLRKNVPDEFKVIAMPPLAIPPDFDLKPPSTASQKAAASKSEQEVHDTLLRHTSTKIGVETSSKHLSSGETALLDRAETQKAAPNIREELKKEEEAQVIKKEEKKGLWKRVTQIREPSTPKEPVVDAAAEKQRLIENQKQGKPINAGEVPTVTEQVTPLDRLLGQDSEE